MNELIYTSASNVKNCKLKMGVELSLEKLYISNTPQTTNAELNTVLRQVLDVTVLLTVGYISVFTQFVAKNDFLINFENRDDNMANK
jgi:hypothetical protein